MLNCGFHLFLEKKVEPPCASLRWARYLWMIAQGSAPKNENKCNSMRSDCASILRAVLLHLRYQHFLGKIRSNHAHTTTQM